MARPTAERARSCARGTRLAEPRPRLLVRTGSEVAGMLLDLSAVTDGLIAAISGAWQSAPIWSELGLAGPSFTPAFTGLAPNAIRDGQGPQLSLFLYHVEVDNAR